MATRDGERVRYAEIVRHLFGWRVRVYLGGTSKPQRARLWRSDTSHGAYVRLRGEQAIGCQWRRLNALDNGGSDG